MGAFQMIPLTTLTPQSHAGSWAGQVSGSKDAAMQASSGWLILTGVPEPVPPSLLFTHLLAAGEAIYNSYQTWSGDVSNMRFWLDDLSCT
jgi:hypothetical protein